MINTRMNLGYVQPTAAKLTSGVHGGNIKEVGQTLAQDSATILGSIDKPTKAELTKDVQALKTQLWARLGENQMGNALMTAGALMGGPHGLVLSDLSGKLKTTLASPQKLDELASNISKFDARGAHEGTPTRGDVYGSLGTHVTGGLLREKVGGEQMPSGSFLAGALANAYQDQGGYNLAR